MVFSSLSFLYFFFPCVVILYFVCRNRAWRNAVLLLASLLFYSWGEPKYLLLMLLAALEAYIGGFLITCYAEKQQKKMQKAAFVLTVALVTANLLIFKYTNFAVLNLNRLLGTALPNPNIALPIGISFYTFQILSYVIDLNRGKVALQKNYFLLLLYVSFFPQLIAGPIVRYQTIEDEIRGRKESLEDAAAGLKRFIIGLAKKVLLANQIGIISEAVYAGDPAAFGTAMYWIGAIAYTLQIYFDFSGYSDMAIGLGRIFGFHFLENFDYPYISHSITEFWRRWHISLSSWFRDYIYIPLGGNQVSKSRWILNIFVVWGLTGFWHGAQWNFLLWGLYYAVLLVIEKLWLKQYLDKLPRFASWCYTMLLVILGWVLFNRVGLGNVGQALRMMFVYRPTDWVSVICRTTSILTRAILLPIGILCMLPIGKKLKLGDGVIGTGLSCVLHGLLLLVCIIVLISSTYNPFIYFRF